MLLTLEEAENKLIEKGLITREDIDADKEKKFFGKGNCRILHRFITAVKNDLENFFFPETPDTRNFTNKATRLFRNGDGP